MSTTSNDPISPLTAAIAAALEFKQMLHMQPEEALFWPARLKTPLRKSQSYARASALLDQAIAQHAQCAESIDFQRVCIAPVVDIVANDCADVPAKDLKLFAGVRVSVADLIELLEERHRRGEDSGFLEVSIRLRGEGDVMLEEAKGERDAVHAGSSKEVVDPSLCHGSSPVSRQ